MCVATKTTGVGNRWFELFPAHRSETDGVTEARPVCSRWRDSSSRVLPTQASYLPHHDASGACVSPGRWIDPLYSCRVG